MANERIKIHMSGQDILMAMSDGNPGALTACMQLLAHGGKVDPSALGGGLGILLWLDTLKIYGERLYVLWSHVCKRDSGKLIAVLRAYQLGQLAGVNEEVLNRAVDEKMRNRASADLIDLAAVVAAVKKRLPNFNPEAAIA